MGDIIFNSLSGAPPYNVYVSDVYGNNTTYVNTISTVTAVTLPSLFNLAPEVKITIVDASGCTYDSNLVCTGIT
jgi:hypothetical protein